MAAPGTILADRYEIVGALGAGGMGTVFEAIDRRFGDRVAIKRLDLIGPAAERAFEREARLLRALKHDGLPRVIDHFEHDRAAYLVMDYIGGDDLARTLETRSPLPIVEATRIVREVLGILEYLHGSTPPVLHRDVKPQNIKVHDGRVYLLDFGLAKGDASAREGSGGASSVAGYSPHYSPLEQIRGVGTGTYSDVFALAATMYTLVTGSRPADALERATASATGSPDPLVPAYRLDARVPEALSSLLERAMSPNPGHRPQDASAMRRELDAATAGIDGSIGVAAVAGGERDRTIVEAVPSQAPEPTVADVAEPVLPRPKRASRRLGIAALLVLAVAALGTVLWMAPRDEPAPPTYTAPESKPIPIPAEFSKEFRGSIGSRSGLLLRITRRGSDLVGMYTWVDANHVPADRHIPVRGRVSDDGNVRLTEYRNFVGQDESASGLFEGRLSVDATSKRMLFDGEWRGDESSSGLECSLVERRFELPDGVELVANRTVSEHSDPKVHVDLEYPHLVSADADRSTEFNRLVEEIARNGADEFVSSLKGDADAPDGFALGSSYQLRYDVLYGRAGILSVRFEVEFYSEGAVHQQYAYDVLTYDVGKGRRIELRDLFTSGARYLETISRYCLDDRQGRLIVNYPEGLGPVAGNYRVWNLTVDGLLFTFPPYQIASFADGTQHMVVPLGLFRDTLVSEFRP